jgi:hypothetical protein
MGIGGFRFEIDKKAMEEMLGGIKSASVNADAFIDAFIETQAGEAVKECKKKTPVGIYYKQEESKLISGTDTLDDPVVSRDSGRGGDMRRGWKKTPVSHRANEAFAWIYNDVKYAPYVEYGHRMAGGLRFLTADGWRTTKEGYVEGQYMLRDTIAEMKALIPRRLKASYALYLKRHMGGQG